MDRETREKVVQGMHDLEHQIRNQKGSSYSGTEDSLSNFKRNAERLGMTTYQVWAVYFMKHVDSILNAIKADPTRPVEKTEGMKGRIHDARIYLEILYCLQVEDEQRKQEQNKGPQEVQPGLG